MTQPLPALTPPPVVRRPRPGTVSVAFGLQLGLVAALLAGIGVLAAEAIHYDGLIDQAVARVPGADPAEVAEARASNVQMPFMVGVPALVLAIWYAATAVPLRRGSAAGRILSLVGTGLMALVCVSGPVAGSAFALLLLPMLLAEPPSDPGAGDPPGWDQGDGWQPSAFMEELYRLDTTASSTIYGVLATATVMVVLLLALAVAVLLLVPPSNAYYRAEPRPVLPFPPARGYPYPFYPGTPYPLPGYGPVQPGPPYPQPPYPQPPHVTPPPS